jgi:hypothetical protein
LLDPNPSPGEPTLARNSGRAPGDILFNLRLNKLFELGRVPASATTQSGGNHVKPIRKPLRDFAGRFDPQHH